MNRSPGAVLDLGTNSTRFLLVDVRDAEFSPASVFERGSVVTRLGAGVDQSGQLTEDAIGRVLEVVDQFDRRVNRHSGQWIGGIATSACRRASNGDDVLDRVEQRIDVRPKLVDGDHEAELIGRGVRSSLPDLDSPRVMDIGGGSTEWIVTDPRGELYLDSRPIGVVTVRERCGGVDGWDAPTSRRARELIEKALPDRAGQGPLVVVGGTGTTLSAYRHDLSEYDPKQVHGDCMSLETIREIRRNFERMSPRELREVPAIQPGREDVMVPGILILETFAEFADVNNVIVSDFGPLAGLFEETKPV